MPGNANFKIGAGIRDVTGPAGGRVMMGYCMPGQKTAGIHMRLRSRAFVIEDLAGGSRVALVCADICVVPYAVKKKVVGKLKERFPGETRPIFDDQNVLICGNHTHSGPGGYCHHALYNLAVLGFDADNFECIVDGIFQSIVDAYDNRKPGDICLNSGDLYEAGWNRSPLAYGRNPKAERQQYHCLNTNEKMTLLKFVAACEVGVWSWFGSHGTSLGNKNRLVSGDHKGYASYLFEKAKGTNYSQTKTFVAAFAQAEEGDVSPNIPWGPPDGKHDFEHLECIGRREFEQASSLFVNAAVKLSGEIDFRHKFVNFKHLPIRPEFVGGQVGIQTCAPAIGVPILAGSTEDGPGLSFIKEGMTYGRMKWWLLEHDDEDINRCQEPKNVLLYTGKRTTPELSGSMEIHWSPEVQPLQIMRIGKLVILAVPFEITTMAGRRLIGTVRRHFSEADGFEVVVAGCANDFNQYITTREEYSVQHYEGAANHFGPYTLNALQQEFSDLAESLAGGLPVAPGPMPEDLTDKQRIRVHNKVWLDRAPLFRHLGAVRTDALASYGRGNRAAVKFWGANPCNGFRNQKTFLIVEKRSDGNWLPIADDGEPETIFRWRKAGLGKSEITIEWTIPQNAGAGEYRIRHLGKRKSLFSRQVKSYEGTSRIFTVT